MDSNVFNSRTLEPELFVEATDDHSDVYGFLSFDKECHRRRSADGAGRPELHTQDVNIQLVLRSHKVNSLVKLIVRSRRLCASRSITMLAFYSVLPSSIFRSKACV